MSGVKAEWPGWETVRLIGVGSFGAVYEIQRDSFGIVEKAALKVITIPRDDHEIEGMRDEGYDDESITRTFHNYLQDIIAEYNLTRSMNGSANIVHCDDIRYVKHDDGIGWDIFIKMELLTPLPKALPEQVPEDMVIQIGIDLCKALELCKNHNIIHRDVKPQNIFRSDDGTYKLGDFGIAKTIERTTGGTIIGTYKYMAPEVYNHSPYGTSADLYSLGLVLYWLLNERRMPFLPLPPAPIKSRADEEAREKRFSGAPIPPPVHGSGWLQNIVLKACAFDPKSRFSTPTEMREALEQRSAGSVTIPVPQPEPENQTVHIVFRDSDGRVLTEQACPAGTSFAVPRVADREEREHIHHFTGWEPRVDTTVAEKDIIYTAQYTAQPRRKKKKYRIASYALIGLIVGAAAALLMTQQNAGSPEQLEWSEWMETLPDYATEESYHIEEQTLYRSRRLETTSSTTESSKSGWKLYDTIDGTGDFGPWSDWSTSQVSAEENREVETQTRYRYRTKETTTGAASTMSGWELYDTTYTWGDYGNWSGWSSFDEWTETDSRDVESKTQYSYRTKEYTTSSNSSKSGWTRYDSSTSYGSWSDWSDTPISSSSTKEVETQQVQTGTKYSLGHYCTGNVSGAQWQTSSTNHTSSAVFNQNCIFHDLGRFDSLDDFKWRDGGGYIYYPNGEKFVCSNSCWTWYINEEEPVYKTQYRSRTVSTTYYFWKWSDWSNYSDSRVSASSDREVTTRTFYRYRDRPSIPTYHFWRWGGWTDWSTNAVSATDTVQVETSLYYRYRDRVTTKTYYFCRWTDWSEFSKQPISASDTVEVQTKTQYRYKSKK